MEVAAILISMPRCDLLLTNATIVTMDERFTVHSDGGLAIAGDSIVSVGPEALGYDVRRAARLRWANRPARPGSTHTRTCRCRCSAALRMTFGWTSG